MSGPQKVNLLELYTSEGCSSCPPKDKWLNSLITSAELYKSFVPLKFHVDYWNYLGWKDPYSKDIYTQRQYQYGKEWNNQVIYTPNFVLNGKEWRGKGSFTATQKKTGILKVTKNGLNQFNINFMALRKYKALNLYASLLGSGFKNKVRFGENAGKTLQHNFVVLDFKRKRMNRNKNSFQENIQLKLPSKYKPEIITYAFWVSLDHSLLPLQAVGGCIK